MRDSVTSSVPAGARRELPWGLGIALGLLLILEVVLRLANPRGVLPAPSDRELAYRQVEPELLAYGAPDVAIIGSSRANRAVVAPLLRAELNGRSRPSVISPSAVPRQRSSKRSYGGFWKRSGYHA